jgi:nucleoside-diphosphate-sugar epimerase
MRVFILGAEAIRSLGFATAQRLLMEGHTVTALAKTDMGVQNLNKGKIRTVSGDFEDADVHKQLVKAEAVIDSEFVIWVPIYLTQPPLMHESVMILE